MPSAATVELFMSLHSRQGGGGGGKRLHVLSRQQKSFHVFPTPQALQAGWDGGIHGRRVPLADLAYFLWS